MTIVFQGSFLVNDMQTILERGFLYQCFNFFNISEISSSFTLEYLKV